MDNSDHPQPCACGDCRDHRREAALNAAKEQPKARRSAAAGSPSSDTPETDKLARAWLGDAMAPWNFCRKLEREKNEALAMLQRIARKGEFMDMEGQRLVVSDWLARRHIIPENESSAGTDASEKTL